MGPTRFFAPTWTRASPRCSQQCMISWVGHRQLGDTSLCDQESRISFTLPLSLPDTKSGLNYIDYEWEDCPYLHDPDRKYLCGRMNREVYEVGTLVVHSHALLHQIGEWSYSSWDENRITLQGLVSSAAGSGGC